MAEAFWYQTPTESVDEGPRWTAARFRSSVRLSAGTVVSAGDYVGTLAGVEVPQNQR